MGVYDQVLLGVASRFVHAQPEDLLYRYGRTILKYVCIQLYDDVIEKLHIVRPIKRVL